MMNDVQKQRVLQLVEALESGEYSQIQGELKNRAGHCCLGVACEVYREKEEDVPWKTYNGYAGQGPMGTTTLFGEAFELPEQVMHWYGFITTCPQVVDAGRPTNLVALNDQKKYTFFQIARVLRDTFLGETS